MPKNIRYLNPTALGEIVERRAVNYPEKVRRTIVSHFPLDKQEAALEETKKCVSILVGKFSLNKVPKKVSQKGVNKFFEELSDKLNTVLNVKQRDKFKKDTRSKEPAVRAIKIASQTQEYSSEEPLTLKRTESIRRFKRLYDNLQSLEKELCFFLKNDAHHDTLQLKRKFYSLIYPVPFRYSEPLKIPSGIKSRKKRREIRALLERSLTNKSSNPTPNITLQRVDDLIRYLRLACSELIENPGSPGRKNSAIYKTVDNLASVWKKYTGKEPTRINYPDYGNGPTHSPFLDYLQESIGSVILLDDVSLPNIAKEVIRLRKPMAKTSSK